ncbi:MAG: hypothetical protein EXS13_05220 [Planctomycetes bacterium]|nr:hypothetical protein [Planctomycetota bacterium]
MRASTLALTLFSAVPVPAAQQRDPALLLQSMIETTGKRSRVRALVRNVTRSKGSETVRFFESFIDVRGGRLRTLQRDFGRATPHLLSVHDGTRLRQQQLEIDEVAVAEKARTLPDTIKVAGAGELVAAAFCGRPPAFDAAALKPSNCDGAGEVIDGVGCTKVLFAGATAGALWIGDTDLFPRLMRVTLGALEIEEQLLELEVDADLSGVEFEIAVPEGRRLRSVAEAHASWGKDLGPEESRWPRPGDDSPDFAAVDLAGQLRLLSETAEHRAVVAFWNPEVPASVEQAQALDAAWRSRKDESLQCWHVAAGRLPGPVNTALRGRSLQGTLVVAGEHAQSAFQQFSIWKTPVFACIDDMQIVEMTNDLEVARNWLR